MKKAYAIATLFLVVLVAGCVGTGQTASKAPQNTKQNATQVEGALNSGKIVKIQNAFMDTILMVAAGSRAINTSELKVFIGSMEQSCIWDRPAAQPGEQFVCRLNGICTSQNVVVVAPGNFDTAQC